MSGRYEDDRGVILDLVTEQVDAVTRITTVKGAIRGNHVHERTTQWTYVVSGQLLMALGGFQGGEHVLGPGDLVMHRPGIPHAWKALEDADCLVFTAGPRAGEDYESDTIRLEEPLLS